jgi:hypothetical protein
MFADVGVMTNMTPMFAGTDDVVVMTNITCFADVGVITNMTPMLVLSPTSPFLQS